MNSGIKTLRTPLKEKEIRDLEIGNTVQISGTIFTARDKAYQRILEFHKKGKDIPIDLEGGVVYHCGPLVKFTNGEWEIVSAGPTTSGRLDNMQIDFLEKTGVLAIIGKGGIGEKIVPKFSSIGRVYLAFPGGAAALAAKSIKSVKDVIWKDLSTVEAVWVLEVENFGPLTVGIDTHRNNLYSRK